jgi:predicted DNA-binding transcriptional regulator
MNEKSMARFLGLAPKAQPTAVTRGLVVVMSVRKGGVGPILRYTHPTNTISRLEAQIEAQQAARREGLTFWTLLDISPPDQVAVAM